MCVESPSHPRVACSPSPFGLLQGFCASGGGSLFLAKTSCGRARGPLFPALGKARGRHAGHFLSLVPNHPLTDLSSKVAILKVLPLSRAGAHYLFNHKLRSGPSSLAARKARLPSAVRRAALQREEGVTWGRGVVSYEVPPVAQPSSRGLQNTLSAH